MKINYSEKGTPISDFEAEEYVLQNYKNNQDIHISTENVIWAAKTLISEDKIDINSIQFYFNEDRIISVDKSGHTRYPYGYPNFFDNWLDRLLGIAINSLK